MSSKSMQKLALLFAATAALRAVSATEGDERNLQFRRPLPGRNAPSASSTPTPGFAFTTSASPALATSAAVVTTVDPSGTTQGQSLLDRFRGALGMTTSRAAGFPMLNGGNRRLEDGAVQVATSVSKEEEGGEEGAERNLQYRQPFTTRQPGGSFPSATTNAPGAFYTTPAANPFQTTRGFGGLRTTNRPQTTPDAAAFSSWAAEHFQTTPGASFTTAANPLRTTEGQSQSLWDRLRGAFGITTTRATSFPVLNGGNRRLEDGEVEVEAATAVSNEEEKRGEEGAKRNLQFTTRQPGSFPSATTNAPGAFYTTLVANPFQTTRGFGGLRTTNRPQTTPGNAFFSSWAASRFPTTPGPALYTSPVDNRFRTTPGASFTTAANPFRTTQGQNQSLWDRLRGAFGMTTTPAASGGNRHLSSDVPDPELAGDDEPTATVLV